MPPTADPRRTRRVVDPLTDFLHDEAAGGLALLAAAVAALVWANVAPDGYTDAWHREVTLGAADVALTLDLRHWVNDGLMAIFFFVVGLEIKRELVCGELASRRAAALPVIAALGGVALPALLFAAVTAGTPYGPGWAIPAATDIAFAVGVLALLGDRIPAALKLFLLAVAIVDDLAAIAIIAVFYAGGLSAGWLLAALAGVLGVAALRRAGVTAIWPYVLAGIAVWVAVHESGVHATIAGVALGLLTPTGSIAGRDVLGVLEHRLHPVSSFVVVPLFALANAGISLDGGVLRDAASSRLAWAVVAGLVVGKCVGIAGAALIAVRLRWAQLPDGVNTGHVWGAAAIGGIGFTVSLFIAQLAYETPGTVDTAKVGIFAGSLLSGALGAALLLRQPGARSRAAHRNTSAGQVSQVMCHVRSPAEP